MGGRRVVLVLVVGPRLGRWCGLGKEAHRHLRRRDVVDQGRDPDQAIEGEDVQEVGKRNGVILCVRD